MLQLICLSLHLSLTYLYLYLYYHYAACVPHVYHFGQEGLHNVPVIDLLGPNLEDLFDMYGRRFMIKTIYMVAKQMVSGICLSF